MTHYNKVLITGITGLIGRIVLDDLKGDYDLTGLARRPMEEVRHFRGDISDLDAILPAFEGQDAVVHLAADPSQFAPWDSVLPHNLVGTYNALEACRIHGVKRMIFASSNHAVGMYERDHPYHHIVKGEYEKVDVSPIPQVTHTSPVRPDGFYGISKAYAAWWRPIRTAWTCSSRRMPSAGPSRSSRRCCSTGIFDPAWSTA